MIRITPKRLLLAGAGGVAAVGFLSATVVAVQAWIATHRTYVSPHLAPPVSGMFGDERDPQLRLVMFGDSTAAGLGVDNTAETVGGRLAHLLSGTGRSVRLESVAIAGSRAADLATQVSRALVHGAPDIAVLLVGVGDAMHFTQLVDVESYLSDAVRRLRAAGSEVIVGTCPDLRAIRAIASPLREIVAWSGRRVAETSERATISGGGTPVDLAARTGGVSRADPGTLCEDEFHPSADGYQLWALALYPAAYEASRSVPTSG